MSDQPKPTTGLRDYHDVPFPEGTQPMTGEWTEGKVFAYFEGEDFKGLAEAINAALDAAISEAHSEGRRKQAQYEVEHNQKPLMDALKESNQMLVACSESSQILKRVDRSGGWQKAEKGILDLIQRNTDALAKVEEGK